MNFSNIAKSATAVAGRTGLHLQKHSPAILTVAGVTGMVVASVLGAKATLKASTVADELREDLDMINGVAESMDEAKYSAKEKSSDKVLAYSKAIGKYTRLYGPAVTLGAASIVSILVGHNILHKRNLAVVAAYKSLEEGFNKYRDRVRAELGDETEYDIRHDVSEVKTKVEDGKEVVVKLANTNGISVYARYFDEFSQNWQKEAEYNLLFLKVQQSYFNDLLTARGHVFLNEVYEALGLEHTGAGAVVGWVRQPGADNFVDFGLYSDGPTGRQRRFINGDESAILLDFNVDGMIYDLI